MLVKWIDVVVEQSQRPAFHRDQIAWAPLADAPGFVGQVGGWHDRGALVLGYWADRDAYDHFMQTLHDPIWKGAKSAQIAGIQIEIWDAVLPMPGAAADLPSAMSQAVALSYFDWQPERDDAALMALAELQPDLMQIEGHLGSLGTRRTDPLHYRVPSIWGQKRGIDQLRRQRPNVQLTAVDLVSEWTILPGGVEPVLR